MDGSSFGIGAPEPAGPGAFGGGPVEVVRTRDGAVYFRPRARSRAWDRLGQEAYETISAVQEMAGKRAELDHGIGHGVEQLRALGVSWDVIGWCVGMTGEGARLRWSERED